MRKIEDRKKVKLFILLFSVTYMISYITRINYGAIISEIQSQTGISKSLLSMSLTGSFITYGVGQIISGIFGDRISPKKLVSWGLAASVCMNFLMPLCKGPYQMLVVWSVNGFAQSFMWPPIVKIMTEVLSETDYKYAIAKVSWGSSIGTIFVYLVSPLLISALHWRSVFAFSAILGLIMIFVWNRYSCDVKTEPRQRVNTTEKGTVFLKPILLGILFAIIMQGMLRDGVTTWMPSYIAETYNLSNEISILTGVVLPVFSIVCFQIATKLYTKRFNNPVVCAGLLFGVGVLSALVLRFSAGQIAAVSVFMFAVLTGCMHGVNLMLVCMVPPYFQSTGKVSTVSGILNASTYIGSAVSTYGIAVLSEDFGWNLTIVIWQMIAICGTCVCLICSRYWDNYKNIFC